MITLSGFRPVTAISSAAIGTPPPAPVRFGFDDWDYYYPSYVDLNPRAEFWSAFVPNEKIKDLFGANATSLSKIIDRQADFETLWKTTGLPDYDRPQVDFSKSAVVFVAAERKSGTNAIPFSMRYNKRWDDLDVYIPIETDTSRNPGTAWYLGVVPNCAEDPPPKGVRRSDNKSISRNTRVSARQTRDA